MYKSKFYTKILGFSWAYNYNDIWNLIIWGSRVIKRVWMEFPNYFELFSMTPLVNVSSVVGEVEMPFFHVYFLVRSSDDNNRALGVHAKYV